MHACAQPVSHYVPGRGTARRPHLPAGSPRASAAPAPGSGSRRRRGTAGHRWMDPGADSWLWSVIQYTNQWGGRIDNRLSLSHTKVTRGVPLGSVRAADRPRLRAAPPAPRRPSRGRHGCLCRRPASGQTAATAAGALRGGLLGCLLNRESFGVVLGRTSINQSVDSTEGSIDRRRRLAALRGACMYVSIHPNRYDKLLDRTHRKRAPRPEPALPRAAGSGTTIQPPWPRLFLCAPRAGIKPWARAALCFGPAGQPPPLTRRRLLVPTPPRRRARSQQAAGSSLHAHFL